MRHNRAFTGKQPTLGLQDEPAAGRHAVGGVTIVDLPAGEQLMLQPVQPCALKGALE